MVQIDNDSSTDTPSMGVMLGFPPALEARFEADTGAARSRALLIGGVVGVAFYLLYLVADYMLTPDVFLLSVALRAGIIAPLSLGVLMLLAGNPRPFLRESIITLVVLMAGLTTPLIMALSDNPLRDAHREAMVLVVLFLVIVQRIRFPYAITATLVMFAASIIAQSLVLGLSAERVISGTVVFFGVSLLSLVAGYMLERETRRTYLLQLAERRRGDAFESQSRRDPLTGLGNRRALDDALARLGLGNGTEIAVIIADIDHFKSYNDTLGHQAGDICLKRVGSLLASGLRGGDDRAVRYGGEEFLILLPDTDLGTATAIAERMRAAISNTQLPHPGRPLQKVVTASFGVASGWIGKGVSADEIIASADTALYAAKNAGRNQVWPRPRERASTILTIESRQSDVA